MSHAPLRRGHPTKRRSVRSTLGWVSLTLLVLLTLVLVYGSAIEPRVILDVRRYDVAIPHLDPEDDGTKIAVFSDLQTGMWWANDGMVERVVADVVQEEPAAVLVAGDLLYSTSPSVEAQVEEVVRQLRPLLEAEIPTFAVLGNHDYAAGGADELTAALEAAGIPVLENEALPVREGGAGALHVVGLAATRPGLTDVDQALAAVPDEAPRVVVMHNPTAFPDLPPHSAPVAVAGHTHCGQIALPALPRWSYLGLTSEEEIVADGWAPTDYGSAGNKLYVTCGIGFSLVPVRINAPPQLVYFTLQAP